RAALSANGLASRTGTLAKRAAVTHRAPFLLAGSEQQERGRLRTSEPVALTVIAAQLAKKVRLRLGFDAFGQHLQAHAVAQADHRSGNRDIVEVVRQAGDKALIQFQLVERQTFETRQRRIAGAKIID